MNLTETTLTETFEIVSQLTTTNDLLGHIYTLMLFSLGVICAVAVLVLLYKFLRKFF